MDADHAARIDRLLGDALDRPDAERAAFLDEACGHDVDVRAAVEQLLHLADAPAPALEPGVVLQSLQPALLSDGADPRPGDVVGGWRVVDEIGRGGMGTVFLVERANGAFPQLGALKLISAGGGRGDLARRLARERRILASLTDSDIVRVLDGGQAADGREFLVMEYVDGRPIDRYADEQRLPLEARLALFTRVCRAVEHAHRHLIVHRDIKPSNILVTADGEPRLLDFGIARLLAPTEGLDAVLTQPVARVLTPDYASPEQVRGEPVSVPSDVYQLGLLLYELLAGSRAQHVGDLSRGALARVVCEDEPAAPSAVARAATADISEARQLTPRGLVRALSGDLDTIVTCALRKEPERRYPSVAALVDDIERYLQQRPVRARPDRLSYRAGKFIGRHRAAVAVVVVMTVSLGVGLPLLARQQLEAARQAARADQVEEVLRTLLYWPSPDSASGPRGVGAFLDDATRLIRQQFRDEPHMQARLLLTTADVYVLLGRYSSATEVLADTLQLRRAASGPDSPETAEVLERLGQSQHFEGRYGKAEASLREALRIHAGHRPPGAALPSHPTLELADVLRNRGALLEAEALATEVVSRLRQQGPLSYTHARALRDWANALRDRGRLSEAQSAYEEAMDLFPRVLDDPGPHVPICGVYLGRLLIMRGALDAADPMLVRNLEALRAFYGGDHPLTGTALRDLGLLRLEQGRLDEAEAALMEARAASTRLLGDRHPLVPRIDVYLADLARRRGRPADAAALAEAALERFTQLGLSDHPSAIEARLVLGEALLDVGRHEGARATLGGAVADATRQFVSGDARTARIRAALERARHP